ncbi:radical SAM protein [Candidatus Woesearchaeota archaeon]|nr:radical SAM protein [Candidatus Woesearchaeota archaeon]
MIKNLDSMKIRICLINVTNKDKMVMNKDLNGGFGTCDDYGNSITSKIIRFIKSRTIKLPIISYAFLQAIFKQQGHEVEYYEDNFPDKSKNFDLILIYGTIVDFKNENMVCIKLKQMFPTAKIGIFGPFPSVMPELFKSGDFVIVGEAEAYFMNDFKHLDNLRGYVKVSSQTNMESLPSPCYDGFPINKYSYYPAIRKKPLLTLQASKGCPYSCRYYCVYGNYQGVKIRQRSPRRVVEDMIYLKKNYNVKGIQFRDPTFGFNRNFIQEFCNELKHKNLNIDWGMETRLDLLNKNNIKMMYDVGLRNINVGIETINLYVAKKNRRKLIETNHQEEIIKYCKRLGINISAFFIIGYEGDTKETIENTIKYAIKINAPLARFSVATPYPSTEYYELLEKEGRLLIKDFERYNQFTLVYKHKNLNEDEIRNLLEKSYRDYYFRMSYILSLIMRKVRMASVF